MMQKLPLLKPGDSVELVAPAARISDQLLSELIHLLESWQLKCIVSETIFGKDLLCANTDENRFRALEHAFHNQETQAIICVRGGYGSMRLLPKLLKIAKPKNHKLFLGMSDITALHLFLQKNWQWPILHGALSPDKFTQESIAKTKAFIFREIEQINFVGAPLNAAALRNTILKAPITGGNLCLVQASIGTPWQIETDNQFVFLEETGERGYRIDRMLEHLQQANIFKNAAGILLGDFIEGKEPNGTSLIDPVLKRFAETSSIPVIKFEGIGHSSTNFPLPFGTNTQLQLGNSTVLSCIR